MQIDVPEGLPVDEVMKRFKNESRRVNTVGEVSGCADLFCEVLMLLLKSDSKHCTLLPLILVMHGSLGSKTTIL